jgi:hypothetical protein
MQDRELAVRAPADEARRPVFLVGSERSGTTLLRLMLDHHPEIAFLSEFEFAVSRVPDNGWPDLDEYREWLTTDRIFRSYNFDIDESLSYPDLVRSFLHQKRARENKPRVGATVHKHFDVIERIWPDARYIHLVRDPRDVARSCVSMGWAGNGWTGAERWVTAERLWNEVKRRVAEPDRHELRFEQLVRRPEEELGAICRFIGVPYSERMFDYATSSTYARPNAEAAEQWRRTASDWHIQLVESRVNDMLTERGYTPSGLPALPVPGLARLALEEQDRWSRRMFRVRRYGPALVIGDALARRLPAPVWQKRSQLRLDEIDNRHLK